MTAGRQIDLMGHELQVCVTTSLPWTARQGCEQTTSACAFVQTARMLRGRERLAHDEVVAVRRRVELNDWRR